MKLFLSDSPTRPCFLSLIRFFSLVTLSLLAMLTSCHKKESMTNSKPPEVIVGKPQEETVVDFQENTGTVASIQQVNLVARVSGYLEKISFRDGQYVHQGDLLFTIQQDSYQEDVKKYQAQLDYDSSEYQRQLGMLKENATSEASVEEYLSNLQVDQANLANSKLNLSYTEVKAPFDGLVGAHQVDIGAMVGSNQADPTVLVTLEKIAPIYVNFNINTGDALQLRKQLQKQNKSGYKLVDKLPVYVGLSDEEGTPHQGLLDFVANEVDTSTGTIQARAVFPNADLSLIPGFFVRVKLAASKPYKALTVPNSVIQSDQAGEFLWSVNEENEVVRKSIKLGPKKGDRRAILEGITAQDRIITTGVNRVTVHTLVIPREESQASN
jgi:membrane fusion protein, multidrug efflux system